MSNKRVMVAMSGGVDSAACALLLLQQGYEVVGMTLQTGACEMRGESSAFSPEIGAAYLCKQLHIPHVVVDARAQFAAKVVDTFTQGYQEGITPNPCICCNNYIKFPLLQEAAQQQGCSWIATGHYAQVLAKQSTPLHQAKDLNKDQSYVLYGLPRSLFNQLLLPLGSYTKDEVRSLVADAKLTLAGGSSLASQGESQDICFVPQDNHLAFLQARGLSFEPGDIVNLQGQVLGQHHGLAAYTIGQRHGLGIGGGTPYYVVDKDVASNRLIAGTLDETRSTRLRIGNLNWLINPQELQEGMRVTAKIRYRSKPVAGCLRFEEATPSICATLTLELEAGEAVAPGQAAVFYGDGKKYPTSAVLGGGTILREHQ